MYMDKLADMSIIDCHTHIFNKSGDFGNLLEAMRESGIEAFNVLSLASAQEKSFTGKYLLQNLLCLLIKASYPGKTIYTFGSLNYPLPSEPDQKYDFPDQARRLVDMGFDGFKMIEGKPDVRKLSGLPLDSEIYDGFYSFLESEKIPLLYHVADPEEFWDIKKVPSWAVSSGWYFGDGTFPEKKALYREVDGFLQKFPRLKVVFAHFYFKSASVEAASEFLDRWPNVSIDITPGSVMYPDFSADPERWREFFIKYQNRILFGTDSVDTDVKFSLDRNLDVRYFLETKGEFKSRAWDCTLTGICLDKEVLEKIYRKNFISFAGNKPKSINPVLAAEECRHVMERLTSVLSYCSLVDEAEKVCGLLKEALKDTV
jgi:predicted TIM-barrel fold metal-dependent hydrolase